MNVNLYGKRNFAVINLIIMIMTYYSGKPTWSQNGTYKIEVELGKMQCDDKSRRRNKYRNRNLGRCTPGFEHGFRFMRQHMLVAFRS